MPLWGLFSDDHGGVYIDGTREGLRDLARQISGGVPVDLPLDEPRSEEWAEGLRSVDVLRIVPTDDPTDLIRLHRDDRVVAISGNGSERARIVGGPIRELSGAPFYTSGVGTHLHFDPTTDPDNSYFSPDSTIGEIIVNLKPEEA